MNVVEGTSYPGSISIEVINTTDKEIGSGNVADYKLQVERDSKWYWLKEDGSYSITAEIYFYTLDVPVINDLNWTDRYGTLSKGRYRIIKEFSEYNSKTGYSTFFMLAAEFNLE
ncbi:immunoglobulin-like domain-containing protein [Methanobacterium sp.]|uniref:immunoglobulin-like domain-containing protein n=1 Tax=Methanobacterium sp. TaxID=2164 RepID=UPI00315941CF